MTPDTREIPMSARLSTFLFVALTAFVVTGTSVADPSAIPPDPAELQAALSGTEGLAGAIAAAETAAGDGEAVQAQFLSESNQVLVTVARADGMFSRVIINMSDGDIVSVEDQGRFPGDPVSGEWTETESGLKYYDMVVGTGEMPAGPEAQVEVHYTGWLNDGTKFDSSVDRGETITFGLNRVIPGWTEGVGSMKVGGKRKLIIPASIGYGAQGTPGGPIPPNATLIFDVELVSLP